MEDVNKFALIGRVPFRANVMSDLEKWRPKALVKVQFPSKDFFVMKSTLDFQIRLVFSACNNHNTYNLLLFYKKIEIWVDLMNGYEKSKVKTLTNYWQQLLDFNFT